MFHSQERDQRLPLLTTVSMILTLILVILPVAPLFGDDKPTVQRVVVQLCWQWA